MSTPTQGDFYPIRTVAGITGVNPVTLRAWERRYGLITPHRSPKGHRLYSRHDIERIQRILTLLEQGIAISRMKSALEQATGSTSAVWEGIRQQMLAAITRFDENALDDVYNEALANYPRPLLIDHVLVPLLREIGHRWERGSGLVAEEHFFHVYLRNKLGAQFHHRRRRATGPLLICACLPGELHEIGLFLFAQAAADRHYRLVMLGANTPLADLPVAARRSGADAVVLSGGQSQATPELERGLESLTANLDIPVFAGGIASVQLRDLLGRKGIVPLGEELEHGLRQIDARLHP